MSLDKAILHGKEHREPYRGSARFDVSCRVHGGGYAHPCGYCQGNRLWSAYQERAEAREQLLLADELIQDEVDLAREAREGAVIQGPQTPSADNRRQAPRLLHSGDTSAVTPG